MSGVNLIKFAINNGPKYGKHKVPRFIYHLTNKSNYESMLNDGFIKMSKDDVMGEGIFMTELPNLFKRWRKDKSWGNSSLQEELINQVAKGKDEIVILRIPTKKLNHDLLRVRSQNLLFNWYLSPKCDAAINVALDIMKKIPKDKRKNWVTEALQQIKKNLSKNNTNKADVHLTEGSPAKNSSLFKQRKEAIEYVYREDIPISDVEKIGELDVAKLRASSGYDPIRPMRSIFTNLLAGTPEVKGAELLNC